MVITTWKFSLNEFMDKDSILKKRVDTLNEFRALNLGTKNKPKKAKGRMLAGSVTTRSQTLIKQWMNGVEKAILNGKPVPKKVKTEFLKLQKTGYPF